MDSMRTAPYDLVLQTNNPDEAAAFLGDAAIPYVSELMPGSPSFGTQIFATQGEFINLSRVLTSGAMRVRSRLPADFYAVVLDLKQGAGVHQTENTHVTVGREFAFVQSPLQEVEVLTTPNFEVLFVRIARDAVVRELEKLLGREAHTTLVFKNDLRLASMVGRRLRELSEELRRISYASDRDSAASSASLRQVESEFITLLLQGQAHNYRRFVHRGSAGDFQIRSAEEFMRANAHLPISLGDVCQAAGVNARTLQDSFQKKRDCTPMAFLRRVRMEEVRSALLRPVSDTSVTGMAAHWGFLHFGRFSRDYRIRYGELPSETLRRSRKTDPAISLARC